MFSTLPMHRELLEKKYILMLKVNSKSIHGRAGISGQGHAWMTMRTLTCDDVNKL